MKRKIPLILLLVVSAALGIIGCQNQEKTEETTDLSKEPVVGTWFVSSIALGEGADLSAAEMLDQKQTEDVTYYEFKPDGTFTSEGYFKFGSTGEGEWNKKDKKYVFLTGDGDIEIKYTDTVMKYEANGSKIELTRGEKTAEEILKEAGMWRVDELSIVSSAIADQSSPYYVVTYEIKNNMKDAIIFNGISIKELDAGNNILEDYYSYNKNAKETEVQPGQSLNLELTFSSSDGAAKIESSEYTYTTKQNGQRIVGKFSAPFVVETGK